MILQCCNSLKDREIEKYFKYLRQSTAEKDLAKIYFGTSGQQVSEPLSYQYDGIFLINYNAKRDIGTSGHLYLIYLCISTMKTGIVPEHRENPFSVD
jgi:hypothetical protein